MKPGIMLIAALLLSAGCIASDNRKVQCESGKWEYRFLAPSPTVTSPLILLLHGAGDDAENFIDPWKKLAKKEGIVLIAPQLNRDPKFEDVALATFRCMIDDAAKQASIDRQRIYIFGHSAGGYLAYDGAALDSEYYAAVAVHAMEINPDYAWVVKRAKRKTPIAIYIGDSDQFFSEERARRTRDLLMNAGFPVRYTELKGHDHNYYAISDKINEDVWQFLKDKHLDK